MDSNVVKREPRAPLFWLALTLALAGVALYNWWVGATIAGILPSPNMLFSDLEADGQKYARLFSGFDFTASALFLIALILAGSRGRRREWLVMLGFAASGMSGGLFNYSCAEAVDPACRYAEWHFQLPLSHYIHMLSGIFEFALVIVVILMARKRHGENRTIWRWINRAQTDLLLFALPLIAATYLLDRWEAVVEPMLLMVASSQLLKSLAEPTSVPQLSPTRDMTSPASRWPFSADPTGSTIARREAK